MGLNSWVTNGSVQGITKLLDGTDDADDDDSPMMTHSYAVSSRPAIDMWGVFASLGSDVIVGFDLCFSLSRCGDFMRQSHVYGHTTSSSIFAI